MSLNDQPHAEICLSEAELRDVIETGPGSACSEMVTLHLEQCVACQHRLHSLAGAGVVLPSAHSGRGIESVVLRTLMERLRDGVPGGDENEDDAGTWMEDVLEPPVTPGTLGSFAGYDILERLAGGGMGIVCKGFDRSLNRVVAIKILSPGLAVSAPARARFVREARAAAAIAHEHVVAIHAVGEERGLPFLVMQFVKGRSLQARLEGSQLTLPEILRIGAQTASGLEAAHAQGLVHRDIKPGNILLENSVERVRLTDFGLARAVDEPGVTRHGTLAGTPEYMSPEQARGERIDARSDLFSFGCVLFAMATGHSPFAGPSLPAVLKRVCEDTPPPVHKINTALPPWFSTIVQRLLAKEPADRTKSAAEISRLLSESLAKVQTRSSTERPVTRVRRRAFIAAAAIAAAAGLTFVLWPARPPSAPRELKYTVLRPGGAHAGSYGSLSAAVAAANSKDVVEINETGVITCEPVNLGDRALTLRAASGASPVLVNRPNMGAIISTAGPLVLEGLELRAWDSDSDVIPAGMMPGEFIRSGSRLPQQPSQSTALVYARGPSVRITRCRLVGSLDGSVNCPLLMENVSEAALLDSGFYQLSGSAVRWRFNSTKPAGASQPVIKMTNCVGLARVMVGVESQREAEQQIELNRNTVVALWLLDAFGNCRIRTRASENVFNIQRFKPPQSGPARSSSEYLWEGEKNIYRAHDPAGNLFIMAPAKSDATGPGAQSESGSWLAEFDIFRDLRRRPGPARPVRAADFRLPVEAASLPKGLTEEKLRQIGARLEQVEPAAGSSGGKK